MRRRRERRRKGETWEALTMFDRLRRRMVMMKMIIICITRVRKRSRRGRGGGSDRSSFEVSKFTVQASKG